MSTIGGEAGFSKVRENQQRMFTVTPPRKKNLASSLDSDRRNMIALQPDGRLLTIAASINAARQEGTAADMQRACTEFLRTAYDFYEVP